MELKDLPKEVAIILSQWLENSDLLSLMTTSRSTTALFSYKPFWLLRAKQCRIYQPEFDQLDSTAIKARLVAHIKTLYQHVRTICPQQNAKLLTTIVLEDNAQELELQIVSTAKKSATALMPIAMKFGRVGIMNSLLTHFQVSASPHWLLQAIRFEQVPAVRYLVEVMKLPLFTDQPYALLPCVNRLWDADYQIMPESGRHKRGVFRHFNELLLREIIRCHHPEIVKYLKKKINERISGQAIQESERYLLALLNRHSIDLTAAETVNCSPFCETIIQKML
jgi:hypothetical protein